MRAFIAARSAFTEDALAKAAGTGLRQFVILGAGLDTFAWRNPWPRLVVFEVDHPATQAWKRAQLAAAGMDAPPSLRFVPIDFERQSLLATLQNAGFRQGDPALLSWLGVTMYLERERVLETLSVIGRGTCSGTKVIFDYARPSESVDASIRPRYEALIERHAATGVQAGDLKPKATGSSTDQGNGLRLQRVGHDFLLRGNLACVASAGRAVAL